MKRMLLPVIAISGALFIVAHSAQAMLIKVDFTATGFTDVFGSIDKFFPPAETVSGFIEYHAASPTDKIESLSSIHLTIKPPYGALGHTYELNEVGFIPLPEGVVDPSIIGGTSNYQYDYVNGVSPSYNDFMLIWTTSTRLSQIFIYTMVGSTIMWTTSNFTKFLVEAVPEAVPEPVPEPGTMLLLGSGLAGLVGYGRRMMKK